jgi:hypothetical protein
MTLKPGTSLRLLAVVMSILSACIVAAIFWSLPAYMNFHSKNWDAFFMTETLLSLPRSILSGRQILESHDVQWVERHNLAVLVQHGQRAWADENQFRMADRIFVPIRGAQAEWPETARQPLAYASHVHGAKLLRSGHLVNCLTGYQEAC